MISNCHKIACGLLALLAGLPAASAAKAQKEAVPAKPKKTWVGDALFATNAPVRTFKIDIVSNELAALQRDQRAYVRGTITEGTNVVRDAGLHLKGNGSFRPLHEKPSFVVNFDRYVPDQKYLGLEKIMLNNSSQDGTFLAEMIAGMMFRDANVPCPRVTHSRVMLNGRDLGVYVTVEAENKDFLKHWFRNNDGSLYENYVQDIDQRMDQDNGDDTSQRDVQALAAVTKMTNVVERWARMQQVLDVDRYVSHLVCEIFTSHTDGYAMNRNNYRIYHNPDDGRFTFLAHGLDWGYANTGVSIRPPLGSLVTGAVLTTPQGREMFRQRLGALYTNIFNLEVVTNRVNCAVARLLAQARHQNETNEFRRWGNEMNGRLVARHQNIRFQFDQPEPQPLAFDAQGVARLKGWAKKADGGEPLHEETRDGARRVLRIRTGNGATVASWRTTVLLKPGRYVFEGEVRGAGIEAGNNETGQGAGLRISGDKRQNKVTGTADWTRLGHDISIEGAEREVVLVCELRANKGEAWFDLDSLRLVRR
jgi:hypothetical protein